MQTKNIETPTNELLSKPTGKVYKTTKNEIATGITTKGHFTMEASKKKTVLQPDWKYPIEKAEQYKNQQINLIYKSIWFLHNTSLYRKVFAKRLSWVMTRYKKENY